MIIAKEWTENFALLILFDKNKGLQSCEAFVTLFGMVKYSDISLQRTVTIREVEQYTAIGDIWDRSEGYDSTSHLSGYE